MSEVYLGNSASPSFLHNIRLIVANAMAPCDFTTDSHQNHIVEAVPQPEEISPRWPETLSGTEAVELALCYRIAVSGALDLFDRHTLAENVKEFAQDPARSHWANCRFSLSCFGARSPSQSARRARRKHRPIMLCPRLRASHGRVEENSRYLHGSGVLYGCLVLTHRI